MPPFAATATNLPASDEEATENQVFVGRLQFVQVLPEFADK